MTTADRSSRSWRGPIAVVAVMAGVVIVIVLVAVLGGRLFRSTEQPSPVTPGIVLTYEVRPIDGAAPDPVVVSRVGDVMRARLDDTGAQYTVDVADGSRVVVEVAVPAASAAQIDALLSPTGSVSIVPLNDVTLETGDAVPDIAPLVTDDQIAGALVEQDQTGAPAMTIELDEAATATFGAWSRGNIGATLAIVMDGRAISVPTLLSPIEDGRIQISSGIGGLAADDVSRVASIVSHDPLPQPVVRVVGPTP